MLYKLMCNIVCVQRNNRLYPGCCCYLSVALHCATAKPGASPRYFVPLLESCAHRVHPLLMIFYAHINAKKASSLLSALQPVVYQISHSTSHRNIILYTKNKGEINRWMCGGGGVCSFFMLHCVGA